MLMNPDVEITRIVNGWLVKTTGAVVFLDNIKDAGDLALKIAGLPSPSLSLQLFSEGLSELQAQLNAKAAIIEADAHRAQRDSTVILPNVP